MFYFEKPVFFFFVSIRVYFKIIFFLIIIIFVLGTGKNEPAPEAERHMRKTGAVHFYPKQRS